MWRYIHIISEQRPIFAWKLILLLHYVDTIHKHRVCNSKKGHVDNVWTNGTNGANQRGGNICTIHVGVWFQTYPVLQETYVAICEKYIFQNMYK